MGSSSSFSGSPCLRDRRGGPCRQRTGSAAFVRAPGKYRFAWKAILPDMDERSPYREPAHVEGLNELINVLEGIQVAIRSPEGFATSTLTTLAREIEDAARRAGVYEPLE
jgi:hypothetical protein